MSHSGLNAVGHLHAEKPSLSSRRPEATCPAAPWAPAAAQNRRPPSRPGPSSGAESPFWVESSLSKAFPFLVPSDPDPVLSNNQPEPGLAAAVDDIGHS